MDTLWADVSEYQSVVTDAYPHPVLAIRACDGTYKDKNFADNYAWACAALDAGRLACLIVYVVYRPNWSGGLATIKAMVGTPHPRMAVMIDVESWGGQIKGNQSVGINTLAGELGSWLGDPARVIGYGNAGDLDALWPTKPPGMRLVVAAYGTKPNYPGLLAHQYADDVAVDPFGPCDANSADGLTPAQLCAALGLAIPTTRKDPTKVITLPMTLKPFDLASDPATWPQRNFDIPFDVAGGWEGDIALAFGGQDWSGRDVDAARSYLLLASWVMPGGVLTPVNSVYTEAGKGTAVNAHCQVGPWVAPHGAIGLTLNFAAPGGGYVAAGRSG